MVIRPIFRLLVFIWLLLLSSHSLIEENALYLSFSPFYLSFIYFFRWKYLVYIPKGLLTHRCWVWALVLLLGRRNVFIGNFGENLRRAMSRRPTNQYRLNMWIRHSFRYSPLADNQSKTEPQLASIVHSLAGHPTILDLRLFILFIGIILFYVVFNRSTKANVLSYH